MNLANLIVYDDPDFLALNKPGGVLSQADKLNTSNIWDETETYFNKKLHLHNRLDRPVSGILLFSKNSKSSAFLDKMQKAGKIRKTYYAMVENSVSPAVGQLHHFHSKTPKMKAICYDDHITGAKKVSLHYSVIKKLNHYTMLEIQPNTGRFHQIRAQLSKMGNPVKGDVKYGARRKNVTRHIHLHAYSFEIFFPAPHKNIVIKANFPLSDPLWKIAATELQFKL